MIILAVVALIALCGIGLTIKLSGLGSALAPESSQTVQVNIEAGYSTTQIAEALSAAEVIGKASDFKLWSKIKGYDGQYQAGIYALSPSMDFETIAAALINGKVESLTFTIPEGYTIQQVADKLAEENFVDRDAFIKLLTADTFDEEYTFLADAQAGENHIEGYLMPNTYSLNVGATEDDFIRVMLDQFQQDVVNGVYVDKEANQKPELSLNELLIVASIIEREAVLDEERPLVASVIYNRLAQNMPLQMCSTVQYILGEPKAVLSYADTQIASPYNTYLNPGLPPGPICSPGLASIKAAMHPADTDYLYFVLSDKLDGSSEFTSDYNEFLRFKDAYDQASRAAEK